jgi:hypothetical protein
VSASGEHTKEEAFAPAKLCLGSIELTPKDYVICHDFSLLGQMSGQRVDGIIGVDCLRDWVVAIDFDSGRLDVMPQGTSAGPDWGESVPVVSQDGVMYVLASAGDDIPARFIVDTGGGSTGSLSDWLFRWLDAGHRLRITGSTKSLDNAGNRAYRVSRLSSLSVGPFCHRDLRFKIGGSNTLGFSYLARYRVTFDFPGTRLYLAKGKRFSDHDPGMMCGLSMLFKPGRTEVHGAYEYGPAYRAGLRPKDIVIEFCGKPTAEWKPSKMHEVLGSESRVIRMKIQRDKKTMEFTFVTKELD